MSYENQYLEILEHLLVEGDYVEDRTGTGCYSCIGIPMEIDLNEGFPLLTTKKINYSNVVGELLFFLSGSTLLSKLRHYQNKEEGAHTIWTDDFEKFWKSREDYFGEDEFIPSRNLEYGGRIYPQQWRSFYSCGINGYPTSHDQITTLLDNIKSVNNGDNTMARRLIVTAWNAYDHTVGDKLVAALPACHTDFQVVLRGDTLNLRFSCRSNDWFLGNPYNTAFYATLVHILAKLTGYKVGNLYYYGTDVHLYDNHVEQARTQLGRKPYKLPELILPEFDSLESLLKLTANDFTLEGYEHHPFIKAPQAS